MGYKSVILVVNDVLKSRKLYEEVFGFVVNSDFGEFNVGFENGIALYKKTLFNELTENIEIKDQPNSFVLYCEYDNIEEIDHKAKKQMLKYVHQIKEQPWAQRVFRVYDYDNHMFEIAEEMNVVFKRLFKNNKTIEEAATITGYTIEAVNTIRLKLEKES